MEYRTEILSQAPDGLGTEDLLDQVSQLGIRQEQRVEAAALADAELETLTQTWSQHCQHKALNAPVHCSSRGGFARVVSLGC
ncbi:MAG: hypothetical protein PVF54_10985 [Anaerolineae bacterium]